MKKGFTVLEVVVATAIIVVVAVAALQLFAAGRSFHSTGEAGLNAQEWARIGLSSMMRELTEISSNHVHIREFVPGEGTAEDSAVEASYDGAAYVGNSILFEIPCRYNPGGREFVCLDVSGMLIYGAPDAGGDCDNQDNFFIEYRVNNNRLVRRLWEADLDGIDILNIETDATFHSEQTVAGQIDRLIVRAAYRNLPQYVEVTLVGRGWSSARDTALTSALTSEAVFRNRN